MSWLSSLISFISKLKIDISAGGKRQEIRYIFSTDVYDLDICIHKVIEKHYRWPRDNEYVVVHRTEFDTVSWEI